LRWQVVKNKKAMNHHLAHDWLTRMGHAGCVERALEDVAHFAQLHSWYKHLDTEPTTFYCVPSIGKMRRGIESCFLNNDEEAHWHFLTHDELLRCFPTLPDTVRRLTLQFPCRGSARLQEDQADFNRQVRRMANHMFDVSA
jgi:hypothetical protein